MNDFESKNPEISREERINRIIEKFNRLTTPNPTNNKPEPKPEMTVKRKEISQELSKLLKQAEEMATKDIGYNADDLYFELFDLLHSIKVINLAMSNIDDVGDLIPVLQRYERDMIILSNRFGAYIGYDDLEYTLPNDK